MIGNSWMIFFLYALLFFLALFAGDIVDGSLRPVIEKDYGSIFRRIEAPVYACLGNHEYIGGKFRIGTRSEYIVLKLRPSKAATS